MKKNTIAKIVPENQRTNFPLSDFKKAVVSINEYMKNKNIIEVYHYFNKT